MLISHFLAAVAVTVISTVTSAAGIEKVENMKNNKQVITFAADQAGNDWQVINDGVMGGLSLGNAQQAEQAVIFSGSLSTENNGGFSSVYRQIPQLPEKVTSVNIRVKGDGNRYQLRMRSRVMGEQIAYKIEFATQAGRLETISFNLADFKASFRGRLINNAPLLKADTISHLGFLITAEQPTDFTLSAYAVEFY